MTANGMSAELLNFVLPDFLRLAWVSEPARDVWAERFQQVMRAWSELEWLSVAVGIRDCAQVRAPKRNYDEFSGKLEARGLQATPLKPEEISSSTGPSFPVVVGKAGEDLQHYRTILNSSNHDEIGALLGYPACCRKAFLQRSLEDSFWDPTWQTAVETHNGPVGTFTLDLDQGPVANMLLRWVGIRAIPHLPCRFDCGPSIALGKRFLQLGIESEFQAEIEWLEQMLSWPAEWSALHGIAEVKTPVLKVCTRTEATANKLVLRWKGSTYPAEGAQGLSFPYKTPARPLMTGSPSFQRALDHHSSLIQIQPLARPAANSDEVLEVLGS
jgi:hypothetical protein